MQQYQKRAVFCDVMASLWFKDGNVQEDVKWEKRMRRGNIF